MIPEHDQQERSRLRSRLADLENRIFHTAELIVSRGPSFTRNRILNRLTEQHEKAAERFYRLGGLPGEWCKPDPERSSL